MRRYIVRLIAQDPEGEGCVTLRVDLAPGYYVIGQLHDVVKEAGHVVAPYVEERELAGFALS